MLLFRKACLFDFDPLTNTGALLFCFRSFQIALEFCHACRMFHLALLHASEEGGLVLDNRVRDTRSAAQNALACSLKTIDLLGCRTGICRRDANLGIGLDHGLAVVKRRCRMHPAGAFGLRDGLALLVKGGKCPALNFNATGERDCLFIDRLRYPRKALCHGGCHSCKVVKRIGKDLDRASEIERNAGERLGNFFYSATEQIEGANQWVDTLVEVYKSLKPRPGITQPQKRVCKVRDIFGPWRDLKRKEFSERGLCVVNGGRRASQAISSRVGSFSGCRKGFSSLRQNRVDDGLLLLGLG